MNYGSIMDIDKGWKKIRKTIMNPDQSVVKIGVLSDAGAADNGMTMAKLAAIQEFGTQDKIIPSRPFIRQTFDKYRVNLQKMLKNEATSVLLGKQTVYTALGRIGEFFKGKVQAAFTVGQFKPNKPSTIRRKGSSQPLVDTGRLKGSINYKVERK